MNVIDVAKLVVGIVFELAVLLYFVNVAVETSVLLLLRVGSSSKNKEL
jgi:hypothetical protein